MSDLNVFSCSARLVDTPTIREVNDSEVTNFTIAINNYTGKDKPDEAFFVDCDVWGSRGKLVSKLDKGASIMVSGRLSVRKYKDKNGTDRSQLKLFVNDYSVPPKASANNKKDSKPKAVVEDVQEESEEDDIPF